VKDHPVFARVYERISRWANEAGEEDRRIELIRGVRGRVLELGSGNGLNFQHYWPPATVIALEPEPTMLELATGRAAAAPVSVMLVRGVGETLPFADRSFHTVVCSLVLCSVEDPERVLGEAARVLAPGGELRFLEHVRSERPLGALLQDAAAVPWAFFAGGCHPNRDTAAALRRTGFEVQVRRFPFGPPTPCRPHVLGVARLPS
jgi:ubiquinone/menaquinone biosynthesis C-methylase UbiE